MRQILFFILFLIFVFNEALSALEKVSFTKYETEHQIIYFSSNLDKSVISRLIKQAKRSEKFIKDLYGWVPDKKIVTVYDRETDMANGWSRSYLKNTIYLYIFPPERYSTLSSYTSWEQGLHVHEYTHSTQIGNTKGFPKLINTVFGNIYFPGGMIPRWALEGVAIYSESLIDGKGRLFSPLYRAYFDSFFLSGTELTLGELNGVSDNWMGAGLQYLFGTYFYAYIVDKTGKEPLSNFFNELSDDIFPFFINRAAKSTLGYSLPSLFDKFIEENRVRVEKSEKDSSAQFASKERFTSMFVDLNEKGYVFSGSRIKKRRIYNFDENGIKSIVSVPAHDSFAKKDSKLIIPLNIRYEDRYYRNEIYLNDLKTKNISRITFNESVVEAVFGNNDDFYYISFRDGINRITHSKLNGDKINEWVFKELNSIYSLSVSSDSKRIIFSGNLNNYEKNLFIFNTESEMLTELRIDGEQYSVYFKNDEEIVFSSEKYGKIVPFSLNLKTKVLKQLLRPQTVALFPKIIDDRIYFIGFDNKGYFPAWSMVENVEKGKVPDGVFIPVEKEKRVEEKFELTKANPFDGMFPALIIPDYQGSSFSHTIGAVILGESNDQERFYDLSYFKTFGGTDRHYAAINYYDKAVCPGFRWYFSYGRDKGFTGGYYKTEAIYHYYNTGFSLSSSFSSLVFLLPRKIVNINHSIRGGIGLSGKDMSLKELKDPLDITPEEKDSLNLVASFAYGFSFSFNPGSYFLFSDMEGTSFSLPFTMYKSLLSETRSIVFSPSMRLSFLILPNGKLGFITRNSLYMRFLSDAYFLMGGDELDADILNLNTFIYGGTSNVTVRGYNYGALGGRHIYYSNNEFRFHLFSIEKGFMTFPLMFKNVQGALFFDIGGASPDINMFNDKFIAGIGGEIKLFTYWWYRVPIIFSFGTAYGLTRKGSLNFYFSLGNSF